MSSGRRLLAGVKTNNHKAVGGGGGGGGSGGHGGGGGGRVVQAVVAPTRRFIGARPRLLMLTVARARADSDMIHIVRMIYLLANTNAF